LKKKKLPDLNKLGKYLNLPFQMLAIIALGVFGDIKLDKTNNWEFPVFTLIFTILAVGLAIYYAIRKFIGKK